MALIDILKEDMNRVRYINGISLQPLHRSMYVNLPIRYVVYSPYNASKHEKVLSPSKGTRKLNVDIMSCPTLDELEASGELFDVIIYNNCLHLYKNPDSQLDKVYTHLREVSHLYNIYVCTKDVLFREVI